MSAKISFRTTTKCVEMSLHGRRSMIEEEEAEGAEIAAEGATASAAAPAVEAAAAGAGVDAAGVAAGGGGSGGGGGGGVGVGAGEVGQATESDTGGLKLAPAHSHTLGADGHGVYAHAYNGAGEEEVVDVNGAMDLALDEAAINRSLDRALAEGRGLHSSTSQLNLSRF